MKTKATRVSAKRGSQTLRFAHPFFSPTPAAERKVVPGVGTRLLDHIKGNLQPLPAPTRPPVMTLADIIGAQGAQDIERSGSISFHAVGDTGRSANSPQGDVPRPWRGISISASLPLVRHFSST